jgi:integrase
MIAGDEMRPAALSIRGRDTRNTLPMQPEPKQPRRVRVERGIYRNPSTGGYEIQYTDSDARCRWKVVPGGLREARVARAEIAAKLGRGERVAPSRRPLREVGEEWLAAQHHLRPRTRQLYRTQLRRHIDEPLGHLPIGEVDADRIAAFILGLERKGLSPWTIRGVLVPLGRILSYAVRRGLVAENAMSKLERGERPRVTRREMRILRSDEISDLLTAVTPSYRPVIATAIFSGLRQGELLGLRWADVDLQAGLIHVRHQLDRGGGYAPPKTPQAYRDVVLMPSLAQLLREHKLASGHSQPEDPVFATLAGKPMYYRNLSRRGLADAIEKAGIDQEGEPRLRFHDLRHTFASLLIAEGLNIVFISRQLGHASPSFTLDVYGGLFDRAEHARRATDALEAGFGDIVSASSETASKGVTELARPEVNG